MLFTLNAMRYAPCAMRLALRFILLCTGILVWGAVYPANTSGGTYTSTKHGADADRSVVVSGFTYTTKGHCAHCHEQHAGIGGTEPTPPAAEGPSSYALFRSNFGFDKNELCYACHETFNLGAGVGYGRYGIYQGQANYEASIHNTSASMAWSPDTVPPGPPYDDAGNCHNCHNPHGYSDATGLIPSMLFARDSKSTDSPAYEMGCEACHDGTQGGVSKDIKAQLNKACSHPTHAYNNRHSLPETGNITSIDDESFGPTNRHAECLDCHNPHVAKNTPARVDSASWYPSTVDANSNLTSNSGALTGVWGVEPTWPAKWTQPTLFTRKEPAEKEYRICFKCHSYYGLGDLSTTNGVSSTITVPCDNTVYTTDQAWMLNPKNYALHPVTTSLGNTTLRGTGAGAPYAPLALNATQLKDPWKTNVGNQTMYCSDCHGADDEASGGAKGPHGSNKKFMLKGPAKYWPTKSDGSTLWDLGDFGSAEAGADLFCTNCHQNDRVNNVHQQYRSRGGHEFTCVTCHVAVSHGSKRSRLIGYASDPEPYNYNGNSLKITGFKKAAGPTGYGSNCSVTCSPSGMAPTHSISDPDP